MRDVDAVVFDVFGTLTDWRTSVADELGRVCGGAGHRADWHEVADAWRRRYAPTLREVLSGELPWQPLHALHRRMLDEVLDAYGLHSPSTDERWELVEAWHRLRPWPDAAPGLERLHATRLLTATLSNAGVGALTRLAKCAGLRFDCVLSAELARSYKPDPRVYRTAAELLGVAPERLLMVACHPDDLEAAAGAGLRTAFVPRPLEWGPHAPAVRPPECADLVAADVVDLAGTLAGRG